MVDRAYTVRELDDLRRCCENRYIWGSYAGPKGSAMSRCYDAAEMRKSVEEMVRTHMIAGHTAKDLSESEMLHDR